MGARGGPQRRPAMFGFIPRGSSSISAPALRPRGGLRSSLREVPRRSRRSPRRRSDRRVKLRAVTARPWPYRHAGSYEPHAPRFGVLMVKLSDSLASFLGGSLLMPPRRFADCQLWAGRSAGSAAYPVGLRGKLQYNHSITIEGMKIVAKTRIIGIKVPNDSDLPERLKEISRVTRLEYWEILERWVERWEIQGRDDSEISQIKDRLQVIEEKIGITSPPQ